MGNSEWAQADALRIFNPRSSIFARKKAQLLANVS